MGKNTQYFLEFISPTLYDGIKSINLLKEKDILENPDEFKFLNIDFIKNKNTYQLNNKENKIDIGLKIKNYYIFIPTIIYLANIRYIKSEKISKSELIEMEEMVKKSRNIYAKKYDWLIQLLNIFHNNKNTFILQYYYDKDDKDQYKNIPSFYHNPPNQEKTKFFQLPVDIIKDRKFNSLLSIDKLYGGINIIIVCETEKGVF